MPHTPSSQPPFHPADIAAALRKKGHTLRNVDRLHDLPLGACSTALTRPYHRAEAAIAETLDLPPQIIWPQRYYATGRRRKPQPASNYGNQARA